MGTDDMVKFLKDGKIVVLLQGRYAGKKAVILKTNDDGGKERPYGHCVVAGDSRLGETPTIACWPPSTRASLVQCQNIVGHLMRTLHEPRVRRCTRVLFQPL